MADDETREALEILQAIPEYAWLVDSERPWFTVAEVSERTGVGEGGVRAWCERGLIPGAVQFGHKIGWRIPRSGLLSYFASLHKGTSGTSAG